MAALQLAKFALTVCIVASSGCLPAARINSACRWSDHAVLPSAEGQTIRAHLVEDIRIAKDLGIRYADASEGRPPGPAWLRARVSCTERSFAEIAREHHVSISDVTAMSTARELWIDLLAVFLPAAILFAAVSLVLVSKIVGAHELKERGAAVAQLTVLTPLAAGVAAGLTQIWGVTVEQLRLGNGHISYRGFELPATRHGWLLWVLAMALFAGIGVWKLLRTREPVPHRRRAMG